MDLRSWLPAAVSGVTILLAGATAALADVQPEPPKNEAAQGGVNFGITGIVVVVVVLVAGAAIMILRRRKG